MKKITYNTMNEKYFVQAKNIARWRLDNYFENWLAHKADTNNFYKKIYCCYYKIFDNKYYNGGLKFIEKELLAHKNDIKGIEKDYVKQDMIYSLHRFGISFQNYWVFDFLHRNIYGRKIFVSDKLRYAYCELLNGDNVYDICTDKAKCYNIFKAYFKRDLLGCYSYNDIENFRSFCTSHNQFIFKPLNSHSGRGIEIFDLPLNKVDDFFQEKIKAGSFVVEELIQQGEELAVIHPKSVNTLRVVTFKTANDVKILAITMRVGCGNSIMDNAGAGGIYAFVDPEYGIIESSARNYKGDYFIAHPDTGVLFPGFKLPKWNEAIKLIHALPHVNDGFTLISWDLAFSNKGWVLVEINDNGEFMVIQNSKTKALKDTLFNYMDDYFKK